MSNQQEHALVERVFLRIGSSETDEQLESALGKFLTPVLLKLDSTEDGIRKKVMELLVHVNKRLKSRPKVQLPTEPLLDQYQDTNVSPFVLNFTILYIKLGFPRLDKAKQGELCPQLMKCLDGRPQTHQDSILQLLIPALEYVKVPQDKAEREKKLGVLTENESCRKLILDYMVDVLLLPYSSVSLHSEKIHAAESASQGMNSPVPTVGHSQSAASTPPPPGMSEHSFKRAVGDKTISPEELETYKTGIMKFFSTDVIPDNEVTVHYIVASSDTRHSVATAADMQLRRITRSVDWNNQSLLLKLFTLFLGTVILKGQPATKQDLKRTPSNTRIRLKIFPYLLKSPEAATIFPHSIQVVFESLYGVNTNQKLKTMAVEFVHHLCYNCPQPKLQPIGSVLLSGMLKLIGDTPDDNKLRGLAYVAVGKLVNKLPSLARKDISLVHNFFDAMSKEDGDTKMAIHEALKMMAHAFKNVDESNTKLLEALVIQNIDKPESQARMMAVQYADIIFPQNNIPSRYVLLLACGDMKEEIIQEASKCLKKSPPSDKIVDADSETFRNAFPDFVDMIFYIKEKADQRITTNKKFVVAMQTIPFNPMTYAEILMYLRMCLAHSAGAWPDLETMLTMQSQSPAIAKYVNKLLSDDQLGIGPIYIYVDFLKQLLSTIGGTPAMYCLLEVVAVAPNFLAKKFIKELDWVKKFIFNNKEDLSEYAAQLYSIIVINAGDDELFKESVEGFSKSIGDKTPEVQLGSIITLGYLIGVYLKSHQSAMDIDCDSGGDSGKSLLKLTVKLLKETVQLLLDGESSMLNGACIAVAEIGRRAPLPLPAGSESDPEDKITKLSVIKRLISIIKSNKETAKVQERAATCLGYICVGEDDHPHRKYIIEQLMDCVEPKKFDLDFCLGEALVFAAQGMGSSAARNVWIESESEYKVTSTDYKDELEWYLKVLLRDKVRSTNPHIRQASVIFLLAVVKNCGSHKAVQNNIQNVQMAFMQLLSENDELIQDIASKGLGLVYEICSKEQKDGLVSELVDTLMTGKRQKKEVTGDTQLFEEGNLGKTPEGGSLSTYKELCSIANEMNHPDLIYKFMHLANHNAVWNSRKGAAFGFTTIAVQAGEQLAPYMSQIVPRLYRYQFDPNPKIQLAMTRIWNALVQDNKKTVDSFLKEILQDLLKNLTSNQWRTRESSCLAVNDLLRGRQVDDVVDSLPELWETCLRVRDDIKESVRNAADMACKTLSRVSIKICDVNLGKIGEKATSIVLPCLLKYALQSTVEEVRAIGLSTLLKITKNAGPLLKPHIPILVSALLEAVSELEPQVLNYLSLHTGGSHAQEKLDNVRIAASKMSPMMEAVNFCVQYVDGTVLPELIPRIVDLVKRSIGVGTKAGCSSFVVSLVQHCPHDLNPFAGKLMLVFVNGIRDKNLAVRKSYALCLGHLCKIAKDSSVEKMIMKLKTMYTDKEDDTIHEAIGSTFQAMCIHSSDALTRHAAVALPLAFFAMHKNKKDERENKNTDSDTSVWEEVWSDITPGTEAGIKLYLPEIIALLQTNIESQSWDTKAQAAVSMSTVASKMKSSLTASSLSLLLTALITGLQGRTWSGKAYKTAGSLGVSVSPNGIVYICTRPGEPADGKIINESLLQALSTTVSSCKSIIIENEDKHEMKPNVSEIVDAVMKECKKEKLEYKIESVKCMGIILEALGIDRFSEMWNFLSERLKKYERKREADDDDDDTKPEMRQAFYLTGFEVLGQSWPKTKETQDAFSSQFCDLMKTSLSSSTWKVQMVILKTFRKYIERSHHLADKDSIESGKDSIQPDIELILNSVIPQLENLKYAVIRKETLALIEELLKKLNDSACLHLISADTTSTLLQKLKQLDGDSNFEVKGKSSEVRKLLISKT